MRRSFCEADGGPGEVSTASAAQHSHCQSTLWLLNQDINGAEQHLGSDCRLTCSADGSCVSLYERLRKHHSDLNESFREIF